MAKTYELCFLPNLNHLTVDVSKSKIDFLSHSE